MGDRKSFWSSVPGVITGVAATVTGLVALVGVASQAGWIGGDGGGGGGGNGIVGTTTVAGGTVPPGGTGGTTPARGELSVTPMSVEFSALDDRRATVTVRNTGDAPLDVRSPTVSGSGESHFEASDVSCTERDLAPGRSCEIEVTYDPQGPGQHGAVMVVAAAGETREVEVTLTGSSLIG